MLKVANLKNEGVYTFKLSSGEEVIAKYVETNDTSYIVTKPMSLSRINDAEGRPSLGLGPFAVTLDQESNQEIPININAVISYFEPEDEIVKGYLSQTSGIQLIM